MTARWKSPPIPSIIALEGLSGAGKTTLSKTVARAIGGVRMDEAYWRLRPRPSLDFSNDEELGRLERSLISEEFRRFQEAECWLRRGRTVVLDTDFLGPLTYVWGLEALGQAGPTVLPGLVRRYRAGLVKGAWRPPALTVYLAVSEQAARDRQSRTPRRHPVRWRDRHVRVGLLERRLYVRSLAPVLGPRWWTVRADRSVDETTGRIARRIQWAARPSSTSLRLGHRLLDAIVSSAAKPRRALGQPLRRRPLGR